MEVSVEVHKIIKFPIYLTIYFTSGGGVDKVVVNWTNYQGYQFDLIQFQISTDISGIMNGFLQYVQDYFQYVQIPTEPTFGEKKISWESWEEIKRSKELLYLDCYFLNDLGLFSLF